MPIEIKSLKDRCVDALQYTKGELLQISANLQSSKQFGIITEAFVHSYLGSRYVPMRSEEFLRISLSYHGRMRDDIIAIGAAKSMEPVGNTMPNGGSQWD